MPKPGYPSNYCSYQNCKNNSFNKGIHMFSFPKEKNRCQAWVKASKNSKLVEIPAMRLHSSYRICSDHFYDWCFKNVSLKNRLVHYAIPDVSDCQVSGVPITFENAKNPDLVPCQNLGSNFDGKIAENIKISKQKSMKQKGKKKYKKCFKENIKDTANTLEQNNKSKEFSLSIIKSGSMPSTVIKSNVYSASITSEDSSTYESENVLSTALPSEKVLLKAMKSKENFSFVNNFRSLQVENNLPESHIELMQSTCIHTISESGNSDESEQVNCFTHSEAFLSAKTLLNYMMNQDVNNAEINFILNLIKRIKEKLSINEEMTFENS